MLALRVVAIEDRKAFVKWEPTWQERPMKKERRKDYTKHTLLCFGVGILNRKEYVKTVSCGQVSCFYPRK
jgi:hypothetical protein